MAQGSAAGEGRAGRLLCLIPALYLLATAAYALLNADQFAAGMARILRYVAVPGILALGLICAALLLPAAARLLTGLVSVSVLAALFLSEAWLTISYLPGQTGLFGHDRAPADTRPYHRALPPAHTYKALNRVLGTARLEDAVLEGIAGTPVLLCARQGEPVTYRTGRYGFRNPESAYAGADSLLLLGDSFAEGICLPDGEDLASRLRLRFPGLINTGTRGAGPLYELAVLGRYGPVLKPRVTVMAFFAGNDWTNLPHEAAMPWLAEALEPGARFGPPGGPGLDAAAEAVTRGWWQQERPPLLEFFRRQKILRNFMALQKTAGVLGLHYPQEVQPQPLYREVLQRAAAVTAQWDGELVVVFVPMVDRFRGLFAHGFVHDRLRRIVAADAAAAGLRMIDLTADFEAGSRDGPLFALDSHFSPAGAELAAAVIAREIAREAQALPEPGRQAAARGETQ